MDFIAILIFAFVLAIDATTVAITDGFCYGLKMEKKTKILIPILFGFFQGFMPFLGYWLFYFLATKIIWLSDVSAYIAAGLLGFLGVKMIIDGIQAIIKSQKKTLEEIEITGKEEPHLRKRQVLVQAIATSIDALAVGISIQVAHIESDTHTNIYLAVIVIALVTGITSAIGLFAGIKIGPFIKKYAPIIGGLVLILLAFNFIFDFMF
ncbi:MAG: manganese efflux pump MntP family protein [Bacilli bacterium]|jgi:putative Mn2+ efflux pump MntP